MIGFILLIVVGLLFLSIFKYFLVIFGKRTPIKYSLHMFRQSLLFNYQEGESLKVSEKEREFLNNFARFISGNNIELFMNHFNKAYNSIDRLANSKILFTQLTFWVMRGIHQS